MKELLKRILGRGAGCARDGRELKGIEEKRIEDWRRIEQLKEDCGWRRIEEDWGGLGEDDGD